MSKNEVVCGGYVGFVCIAVVVGGWKPDSWVLSNTAALTVFSGCCHEDNMAETVCCQGPTGDCDWPKKNHCGTETDLNICFCFLKLLLSQDCNQFVFERQIRRVRVHPESFAHTETSIKRYAHAWRKTGFVLLKFSLFIWHKTFNGFYYLSTIIVFCFFCSFLKSFSKSIILFIQLFHHFKVLFR